MSDLRAACHERDVARDGWPWVSVVVPVRNEATHLGQAVASILRQHYDGPLDVCLAIAPSDDDTLDVARRLAGEQPAVSMVANPAGTTPAGLNLAIAATAGEVVVRVDGHAALPDGYVERAVATMIRTGAVNVGGMQVPRPETRFEQAVADATTSWMGTGGAAYRLGGTAGPADTVYLGVFDRAAGEAVGWFDEELIRNQDYELNIRLRAAGGTVWFDPALRVGYRPRSTWTALARQYYEYGWWKAEVARRHPSSLRTRQVIPPITIAVVATGLLAGSRWRVARLPALVYVTAVVGASRRATSLPRTAMSLVTIHTSWAAGLIRNAVGSLVAGLR